MSAARAFRSATALKARAAPSVMGAQRSFSTSSARLIVHDVRSKQEFDEALKNEVVLLDCFATWCGPCKAISPILEKLSNEDANKSIRFIKIDVDELPELSAELGIRAMPTFMFFKDGKKAQELVGADPNTLNRLIQQYRPSA